MSAIELRSARGFAWAAQGYRLLAVSSKGQTNRRSDSHFSNFDRLVFASPYRIACWMNSGGNLYPRQLIFFITMATVMLLFLVDRPGDGSQEH